MLAETEGYNSNQAENSSNDKLEYVRIRAKRIMYFEKPAIAIYIENMTHHVS